MSKTVTRGLKKLEFGNIPSDGGVSNSWFTLGYTRRETFSFNSEDGESTDFYAEESDTAIDSVTTPGKETFECDLMDFDLETLQKVFGGKIEGKGDNATYHSPEKIIAKEWNCKITPEKGYIFTYPRISLMPKISGSFTKKELLQIHIVCTILMPLKDGLAKWQVQKLKDPLIDLSSVISVLSLGELKNNTENTILTAAKGLNPLLDITQVQVTNITATGATIKEKSNESIYIGSVNVDFTIK